MPFIEKARLYQKDFWEKPQWLQISDLEALASLAEQGLLDLAALFEEKNLRFANQRFDYFLFNRYGRRVIDKKLVREAESLIRLTGLDFWKEDLGQKTTDRPIASP
jgi:hypothetical protein